MLCRQDCGAAVIRHDRGLVRALKPRHAELTTQSASPEQPSAAAGFGAGGHQSSNGTHDLTHGCSGAISQQHQKLGQGGPSRSRDSGRGGMQQWRASGDKTLDVMCCKCDVRAHGGSRAGVRTRCKAPHRTAQVNPCVLGDHRQLCRWEEKGERGRATRAFLVPSSAPPRRKAAPPTGRVWCAPGPSSAARWYTAAAADSSTRWAQSKCLQKSGAEAEDAPMALLSAAARADIGLTAAEGCRARHTDPHLDSVV